MKYIVIQHVTFAHKGAILTMKVGRNTDVSLFIARDIEIYSLYGATKISSFITDENNSVKIDSMKSRRVATIVIAYDTIEEAIATMLEWQKAEGVFDKNIIKTQAIGSWIGGKGIVIKKINKYSKNNIRVEKIK